MRPAADGPMVVFGFNAEVTERARALEDAFSEIFEVLEISWLDCNISAANVSAGVILLSTVYKV